MAVCMKLLSVCLNFPNVLSLSQVTATQFETDTSRFQQGFYDMVSGQSEVKFGYLSLLIDMDFIMEIFMVQGGVSKTRMSS